MTAPAYLIKNKRALLLIIKIAVFVGPWIYVYYRIKDIDASVLKSIEVSGEQFFLLGLLVLLMVVNWTVEAAKWKYATRFFHVQDMMSSLRSVVTGVAFGIITPNRVGEFAGRVLMLPPSSRRDGLAAMTVCSLSQLTVTVFFGCLLIPFFPWVSIGFQPHSSLLSLKWVGLSLAPVAVLLFLMGGNIARLLLNIRLFPALREYVLRLASTTSRELFSLLAASTARYLVFIVQFHLAFVATGLDISITESFISVSMLYAITTIIPTTTLAELGIRCSASLIFVGAFCNYPSQILVSSFLLWAINVAVPSLVGGLLYLGWKSK